MELILVVATLQETCSVFSPFFAFTMLFSVEESLLGCNLLGIVPCFLGFDNDDDWVFLFFLVNLNLGVLWLHDIMCIFWHISEKF